MSNYFDEIEDNDIPAGFLKQDNYTLYHPIYDFKLVMKDEEWYVVMEEEEESYQEMDNRIYLLAPTWYAMFDMDAFLYDAGDIKSEDFDVYEYIVDPLE